MRGQGTGRRRPWVALLAAYAVLAQVLLAALAPLAMARQAETALLTAIICHVDADAPGAPGGLPPTHDCCLAGACAAPAAGVCPDAVASVAPPPRQTRPSFFVAAAAPPAAAAPERSDRQSRAPPAFS